MVDVVKPVRLWILVEPVWLWGADKTGLAVDAGETDLLVDVDKLAQLWM